MSRRQAIRVCRIGRAGVRAGVRGCVARGARASRGCEGRGALCRQAKSRGCEGRGAVAPAKGKLHRAGHVAPSSRKGPGRTDVSCRQTKGELHRGTGTPQGGGARVSRGCEGRGARGCAVAPSSGVLRRQAKAELDGVGGAPSS